VSVPATRPSLAWLTIRLTAIVLAVLVLAHFAVTHLLTDVAETDSSFVATRWQSGIVAATDWLMLVAAVAHGAAGGWTIAGDYVRNPRTLRLVRRALVALALALVGVGTATLIVVLGR
jgi:succinate dehydrogenase / fumarate reductase membrane anchor subunit